MEVSNAEDTGADLAPDPSGPPLLDDKPLGVDGVGPPEPQRPTRRRQVAPPPVNQGAAFVASQRDPDRWAKVTDLATRLRLSPSFVDQNFDELSKAADQHATQDQMAGVSPTLRNWLSDPDNASIAKHEVAPLARVDSGVRLVTPPVPTEGSNPFSDVGTATATGMADLARSTGLLAAAFGHLDPPTAAAFISDMKQRSNSLREQAPDYAKEFGQAMTTHAGDVDAAFRLFAADQTGKRKSDILGALLRYAGSGGTDPMGNATLGETLSLVGAALTRPRGLAYQGIESAASMAPIFAGAAAGTAVGSAVGPLGALAGGMAGTFAGIAPFNVGQEVETEMQKRGVDLADPQQVERALADPGLMGMVRDKALKAGVTSAGVMALIGGFGGQIAAAGERAGLGTVGKMAAKGADALVQAGGVAAGTEAGEAAKGEPMSAGRAISTTLQMLGVGAAMSAVGASRRSLLHPEPVEAAAQATTQAYDAMRAQHDAQALSEVGQAANEAETTASVPDRLRSLIETATGGREASTVYFQSGEWDAYWQGQGASPAKAAADIMGDGGKAYHDAQTTGAQLAIPLSDYVARVAPTDHFEGLLDVAHTRPEGMSFREAQEYLQALPATMHEIATEATKGAGAESVTPDEDVTTRIANETAAQVAASGRSATEAKAVGQVHAAAIRATAEAAGLTPEELTARFPLLFGSAEQPIGSPKPDVTTVDFEEGNPKPYRVLNQDGEVVARGKTLAEARAAGKDVTDAQVLEQPVTPRGRITFGGGRPFNIELLKGANRSTAIHELGHYYTEVLGELATGKDAPAGLVADHAALREWAGATEGEALTTPQKEKIARGFEAYLMEGKAPSQALRTAFFRFKNWLLDVYQHVRNLDVELTPEVRQVFDRLLATKEAIADAERNAHVEPMLGDPASAGMNEKQAERYMKAVAGAHQSAEEELSTKMTQDIVREQSAEWKAWRDPMRAAIAQEVGDRPVYRALDYLKSGKNPDGTDLPADAPRLKLNRESIVATYGKEFADALPRGIMAPKEKGGTNASVIADMFGFANGRELVDALSKAGSKNTLIDFLTDQQMRAEHGEKPTIPDIKEAAVEAVRGGVKRAQLLRLEAEHLASDDFAAFKGLAKKLNRKAAPDDEIRARASEVIGSTKVRDVRADLFEKAAERAHREANDKFLGGDFQGALDAKEKERLATAVFDAATDAKAQVEKALDDFRDVFKSDAKLEKAYDLNYINGARAMLSELGIGASDKGATAYLALVKEYAPDAYENVQAITDDIRNLGLRDYRDLTTDQFTELATTVKQLQTLGRKAKQVVIDGKVQHIGDVLQPIIAEVVARTSERTAARGQKQQLDVTDRLANTALSAEASLRRVESWAREMDGLNPLGPLSKVVREVLNATNAYRQQKTDVVERVAKATEALRKLPEYHDIIAHELGYTFKDRAELLGAMLHTGNAEGAASNLTKLIVGRGWGEFTEGGTLDRSAWDAFVRRMQKEKVLTKADYDWLQASWDFFEELKPELQRAYYDVNGRYMKEVGHTPFETPFGKYAGGYYPAIGDTNVAGGAEIENAMRASEDQLLGTDGKFLMTQPASGMTKTRTGKTWPLVMDASQLPRHLDAVLKYIHMAPPVREVFKVFNHRDFREAMAGVNPAMVTDALIPFLRAASSQRSEAPFTSSVGKAFGKAINYVRQGAMQQIVGANLTILAEQVLHTSALQSMRTADNKAMVYYHDVASAAARIMLSPKKMTEMIHEASPTVETRDHTRLRAAEVLYKDIMDPSKLRTMQEVSAHSIGFVSHVVTALMDKAVWLGAHDRAVQRGMEGQDARDYADAVVRQGLGAHNPEDVAEIQRGNALQNAMLGMYGFFNAKANQLGTDAFAKTMTDAGLKNSKQRMAAVYVFGLLALSMSGAAARDIIGGRKKKDDETWTDVLAEWAGWGQLEAVGRFVPGGAVAVQFAKAALHHPGASADNMLSSPAANVATEGFGFFRAAHRLATGEPVTGKDVKDALGLFGTLLHLPTKALARPISYQMDMQQGKRTPTGPVDYGRGLITGQGGR